MGLAACNLELVYNISEYIMYTVQQKTLAVKKFGKKGYCKALVEKTLVKSLCRFRALNN